MPAIFAQAKSSFELKPYYRGSNTSEDDWPADAQGVGTCVWLAVNEELDNLALPKEVYLRLRQQAAEMIADAIGIKHEGVQINRLLEKIFGWNDYKASRADVIKVYDKCITAEETRPFVISS